MTFNVPVDHQGKIKENEKSDEYLDLARELKMLWGVLVTVIPAVTSAFGAILKDLIRGLEYLEIGGGDEAIQSTALLKWKRIPKRVLGTLGNLLLSL